MALGGDVIQRDVAVLAGQHHPRVVDGGTQRLAEGHVQGARPGCVGGGYQGGRDAVYDGDALVWGGQYTVAGGVGDGVGGDVQLGRGHRVDRLTLVIREGQGQGRVGGVDDTGGDTIQGEAAGGLTGVPDGDTAIVDGVPVERLAEGHVEDARSRIVV